jgi:hypothetical protein
MLKEGLSSAPMKRTFSSIPSTTDAEIGGATNTEKHGVREDYVKASTLSGI